MSKETILQLVERLREAGQVTRNTLMRFNYGASPWDHNAQGDRTHAIGNFSRATARRRGQPVERPKNWEQDMKTISLEELKKLATPGKLRVSYEPSVVVGDIWTLRAPEDGDSPAGGTTASAATAALLAHCWNTHDELVEALEDLAFDAGRVERKFSEGRDWAEWRDLRDKLNALKPLLARVKIVEML